jgi:C1A family cysteine protease
MASRQWYGWRPDTPDHRDIAFAPHLERIDVTKLPARMDLRPGMATPPWNQLDLGSCTGQSIAKLLEFCRKKQGLEVFIPSRLFIYYCEREIEGSVGEDSGAEIRDGLKAVNQRGAPHEDLWPYDISKYADKPPVSVYDDAILHVAKKYARVKQDEAHMKACLAAGYPFVGGFTVYDSFEGSETAKTGFVSMPTKQEDVLGGHAVLICGYDNNMEYGGAKGFWIVCNSWGEDWGDKGYFYMPYEYFLNSDLSADFWTVRLQT